MQLLPLVKRLMPALALTAASGLAACNDDVTVQTVPPEMELESTAVDFGNVQVGTSATRELLIRNTGGSVLTLEDPTRGMPFSDVYTWDIDRLSVPVSGVAVLTLTFKPTDLGEVPAKLVIRSSDTEVENQILDIKGTGVTTTLQVDPDNLSFGNVVINTKKTLEINLTNNSDVDANIEYKSDSNNVRLCRSGGVSNAAFCVRFKGTNLEADNRFDLAKSGTAKIEVEFRPTIAGTRERASFTLKACPASACEVEIRLDGIGVEQGFRCMPPSLDFGQVNPNSCSPRTVSCENIANEEVTVVTWGTTPGSSAAFAAETPRAQVLSEGDSVEVEVTYCPTSLGNDEGTLQIETDNQNQALRNIQIALKGTGGGPDIEVLPPQLNFGDVSLIAPSRRTVVITNTGYAPLQVSDIQLDTEGTGAYSSPDAMAGVIQPGSSLNVTVEFQPLTEGRITSKLRVISNDQDEPMLDVDLIGNGVNLPPCSFEIAPAQVAFGVVQLGRTIGRSFEIRNTGANDCLITSARLTGAGPMNEFALPDGDVLSQRIPAGSAETIRIEYSPTMAGTHMGNVEFSISSPTSPFNTVALSGTGAAETLLIVPNDLDFGTIGVGCASRARTVTIYNTGASAAQIDSINIAAPANPAFSVVNRPAPLPGGALTIAPGQSTSFDVGFRADAISSYAGAVEINGSFGGNPVTYIVSLQGRGALDATQRDHFQQLGKPKVDILFTIDNSCSMGDEQNALSTNFAAFIQFAEAQALEYQIAVTTTDVTGNGEAGRFVPLTGSAADRIVTPQTTPSPETVFVSNVNLGTSGSASELALQASYLALSNPLIFGHNAGFLRRDAVLSLVIVTDEPEQSSGTVDFYINFFLSIKGFRNTNLFSASAISGGESGCNGAGGNASAAPRLVATAARTGGIDASICTPDWSRTLEDLSTTAFGFKSRFFLTNQPVISTIRVLIDMVEVPATSPGGTVNWSYDFATNSINFSAFSTPEPGAEIDVEYTAECL